MRQSCQIRDHPAPNTDHAPLNHEELIGISAAVIRRLSRRLSGKRFRPHKTDPEYLALVRETTALLEVYVSIMPPIDLPHGSRSGGPSYG